MIKYIQDRFAMTRNGAWDFVKGATWTFIQNMSFIAPMVFVYIFLENVIRPSMDGHIIERDSYWPYIIAAIVIMIIMAIISYFQYNSTYLSVYTESGNRRIALAEKLRMLPLSYFSKRNLSDLTLTIMDDATELETIFSHAIPQLVGSLLMIVVAFFGMLSMNVTLTLALSWVIPVALIIIFLSKKLEKRIHQEIFNKKRDVSEKIQEGLDQVQELKSYGQESSYLKGLNKSLSKYEHTQLHSEILIGIIINLTGAIIKLGLPTLALVGLSELNANNIDILTYIFFLLISAVIYEPLLQVLNHMAVLLHIDVRVDRLKEILNQKNPSGKSDYTLDRYDLTFNDVSFSYEEGETVLEHISFTAKQGEVTALIGPSGGGKSTTARLAARFWDPDSGTITIGGEDITGIDPEALLRQYSIVFQDVVLFNASVLDNIRIGRKDATDEEVIEAARLAQCDDFVQRLPNGYQTMIGENGSRLSGGERQRISIARALLKDAPIILLDEATASVDVENETAIQSALSTLIKDKTVIIIAHRLRTINQADQLIVISNGEVVEQGSPTELYEQKGLYYKMTQKSK